MSNDWQLVRDYYAGIEIDGYTLEKEIGREKESVLYKAYNKKINNHAICKMVRRDSLVDNWEVNFKIMDKLRGIPQVLQYINYALKYVDDTPIVFILSQYMDGRNLDNYARENPHGITPSFVKNLAKEILALFHAMKISEISGHNNLKLENIFIVNDPCSLHPEIPMIKVTDFILGNLYNNIEKKDDYKQLALICLFLLERIDPAQLDGKDRYFYDVLVEDYIPKKILEEDPTVPGNYARNPKKLLDILNNIQNNYNLPNSSSTIKLNHPFDYLRCEDIGNSFQLLQLIYSKNFPGYSNLLTRNNTILTGPRGCGKTTIFKNLSMKAQLLGNKIKKLDDYTDSYIAIYYHCNDLYFAFPYLKGQLSDNERKCIIHYFNLSILYEFLDLLSIFEAAQSVKFAQDSIISIQGFIKSYIPTYEIPPSGTDVFRHLMAVVLREKGDARNWFEKKRAHSIPDFLPMDFLSNFCRILQDSNSWIKEHAIYFLLDDYSIPNISKQLQETINDFIFFPSQKEGCYFKISTESITTFHPENSRGKLLEEGREFVVVDLGLLFLSDEKKASKFVVEVINNRLKNSQNISEKYNDIRTILGKNGQTSNQIAQKIRNQDNVLYYGYDIIMRMCSGDIAHILNLIKNIFEQAEFSYQLDDNSLISFPIKKDIQNKAIKDMGGEFLYKIENIPKIGKRLREITEAFGGLAHWYLINRNSKNIDRYPPWQAYKIEIRDRVELNNEQSELYNNLLRYSIFMRDVRGKSIRGAVAPRLYMRKLLIPFFGLTLSKRDNIGLDSQEFLELLDHPDEFIIKKKILKKSNRIMDGNQRRLYDKF